MTAILGGFRKIPDLESPEVSSKHDTPADTSSSDIKPTSTDTLAQTAVPSKTAWTDLHDRAMKLAGSLSAWFWLDMRVLKCVITYTVATAFVVFNPFGLDMSTSFCFLPYTITFVHPARPLGAMVRATYHGFLGLAFGTFISSSFLVLSEYFYQWGLELTWISKCIGLLYLFVVIFFVALIIAKAQGVLSIWTGCRFAYLLTFITCTQVTNASRRAVLSLTIQRVAGSLAIGISICVLSSFVLWPVTATSEAEKLLDSLILSTKEFSDLCRKKYSQLRRSGGEIHLVALGDLVRLNQRTLLKLESKKVEVYFEPFSKIFLSWGCYRNVFQRLEQIIQHMGSLMSNLRDMEDEVGSHKVLQDYQALQNCHIEGLLECCSNTIEELRLELLHGTGNSGCPDNAHGTDSANNLEEILKSFDKEQKSAIVELFEKHGEDAFSIYLLSSKMVEFAHEVLGLSNAVMEARLSVVKLRSQGFGHYIYRLLESAAAIASQSARQAFIHPSSKKQSAVSRRLSVHIAHARQPSWVLLNLTRIRRLFKAFNVFDLKFALKTALTITVLASPSFMDVFTAQYYDYKLYWVLTATMVVLTPSVAASSIASFNSIVGTAMGALGAIALWNLTDANPITICCLTPFLVTFPYHLYLNTSYQRIGSMAMMTFSIVFFQVYVSADSNSGSTDFSIYSIAYLRGVCVAIGVVVGLAVSWGFWPYKAQTQIRNVLSDAIFNVNIIFIQNCILFGSPSELMDSARTPVQLARDFHDVGIMVRFKLTLAEKLLTDADLEKQYLQPFPTEIYRSIAASCDRILNKFTAMRLEIDEDHLKSLRRDAVAPLGDTRQEMIGQLLLCFHVLSGAMILKVPLPPRMPHIRDCREQILEIMRKTRSFGSLDRARETRNSHFYYYYAYVRELTSIINELQLLWDLTKHLFGEIDYWNAPSSE
ncbi:uncharacterized protein BJ171DRAFT_611551 [Polychytrium aggregatum]|uniref:uncharacterized protein n=1 Tax=Polychytrium aggregatum TaxID=110093 RepID=UPI0022FE7408|nr:uncharacterized protein BJ171DRAFT_611551 [Polychytrium aggregatum]KAI9206491.1 hypothetical protein BJ171DRAFT_611551 [Polychytrium aggregatum]